MVKIIYKNGIPFIEINGELLSPSAFRSFRPKPDNISLMNRAGIRLYQMQVSGHNCALGCPYSLFGGVWMGDSKYDFSAFENQYKMFERFAPKNAYFNILIHLDSPSWWKDSHRDSEADSYRHITESCYSEEWKKATADFLKAFITYAEEKHGERIYSYSFAAGYSNEWFDQSLYEKDYDREKNKLTNAWRNAIGKPNAKAPTIESMEQGENSLREPITDDFVYLKMSCEATSNLICYFAKEAQSVLNHEKLIGLFFGYSEMDNQVYWNTNGYEQVWNSPDIDMLYSPAAYRHCRDIDGVSSYQFTVDSLKLHNKLYLHENDHRTELALFPLENGGMLNDCYKSFFDWQQVFRRELANTMVKSGSFWWFDFFGGYYNAPQYEAELKKETEIFNLLSNGSRKSVSEVAVFLDPYSFNCTKETTKLCTDLGRSNVWELHRSGVPFDIFNQNDLPLVDKNQYKVFVFLNSFLMSDELVKYIENELSDKYKFYLHGVGIFDSDGKENLDRTSKICNMNIKYNSSEGANSKAIYKGKTFGFTKNVRPLLYADENDVEVIAKYNDGKIAVAKKGKNIWSALGNVPFELFRDVFSSCSVHIYDENGGGLAICSQFVCAYTTLTEECVLHLKEDGVYHEIWSDKDYICNNGILKYNAKSGTTMLFVKK